MLVTARIKLITYELVCETRRWIFRWIFRRIFRLDFYLNELVDDYSNSNDLVDEYSNDHIDNNLNNHIEDDSNEIDLRWCRIN